MSEPKSINFTRGVPADASYPIRELLEAATAAMSTRGVDLFKYGPSAGFQPLREWIAQWQGVETANVLTGNGSLQLIEFLCLHLLSAGDRVFTEAPTYDRTITLLRRHQIYREGGTRGALRFAERGANVLGRMITTRRVESAFGIAGVMVSTMERPA